MELISAAVATIALTAGALAAFNPCGFVLLPAYLTVIVTGTAEARASRTDAMWRALVFGGAMTLGFIAVFGTFGAILAPFQAAIFPYLGWITIVVALALLVFGIILLRTGELRVPGLNIAGTAPRRTFLSQVLYGVSFALASLSCTIGTFLGLFAASFNERNFLGILLAFLLYALGMGAVIVALSVLAAVAGASVVGKIRRATPVLMRVGGVLLIAAAAYVFYYGIVELRATSDSLVRRVGEVQGAVTRWLDELPVWVYPAIAVMLAVLAVWLIRSRRSGIEVPEDATANDRG